MGRVKVYFPHNPYISRAMQRIRRAMIDHKPDEVEIARKPDEDAVHILDFVGQAPPPSPPSPLFRSIPSWPATRRYVVIYHCPPPLNLMHRFRREYRGLLENALLVVSTYRREWIWPPEADISLYRTPWGYDPRTFYPENAEKRYVVLTTGYVAETECIDVIYDVTRRLSLPMVHVGGVEVLLACRRRFGPHSCFKRFENIPDSRLRRLYSESVFTNAMRQHIGFEVVGVEGYACGSIPLYLDLPCYRDWFDGMAIFVRPDNIREELERIFTDEGIRRNFRFKPELLERFKWGNIAPKIWDAILSCL